MVSNKRLNAVIAVLVVMLCALLVRLFDLQIINGEEYKKRSQSRISAAVTEKAPRGEIMDRNGRVLVSNRAGYSIILQKTLMSDDDLNATLLEVIKLLQRNGCAYTDTLPISYAPYEFTFEDEAEREAWFETKKRLTSSMTAAEVIDYYRSRVYGIAEHYSEEEARAVIGLRYDAEMNGFSMTAPYTIMQDVDLNVITEIEERQNEFKGILVTREYFRSYNEGTLAAHILGGIGKMTAEEYEQLGSEGYAYNDLVGKRGAEKIFEKYLKGTDGIKNIGLESTADTEETDTADIEAKPGNYVVLTIDADLQQAAEESLKNRISEIAKAGGDPAEKKGGDADAGAAVVLDIKNGDVLACATYPTYDPASFNSDYEELAANEAKPMWNRAISGSYVPGSTFKPLVAIAALESGVVNADEIIRCEGIYKYYEDYQPRCWIWSSTGKTHGDMNVTQAIENSCNYYFYEIGRRLGIEKIAEYAGHYGLGEPTGIEFPEEVSGTVSTPEYKASIAVNEEDKKWYPGDTIQSAIGQLYSSFTPIQLANYIAAIANGGTRYKTHILKSIRSSTDGSTVIEREPEIAEQIDINEKNLEAVKNGMLGVVDEGSASAIFENYHVAIGGKTGTAQVGTKVSNNALFVAFAPFDDPEIAVAVVVEHGAVGANAAYVAKDIFDEYFKNEENVTAKTPIGELLP